METIKIVRKPAETLVGLLYRGTNAQREIPQMWDVFLPRMAEIPHAAGQPYGYSATYEDAPEGAFEYIAGVPVTKLGDLPAGMVARTIPEGEFAVFACTLATIMEVSEAIYRDWLPRSGYEAAGNFMYEYYDENFTGDDSELYIYVPVKR